MASGPCSVMGDAPDQICRCGISRCTGVETFPAYLRR